jgi:predicted transcriptional regulator
MSNPHPTPRPGQYLARLIRELAQALGRDDKNVHGDVAVLEAAGLLLRKGRSLSAPWSEVQATVSLGS